jgi:hypothetical protein
MRAIGAAIDDMSPVENEPSTNRLAGGIRNSIDKGHPCH